MNKISIDVSNKLNGPQKTAPEKIWEKRADNPEGPKTKDSPRQDNVTVSNRAAEVRELSDRASRLPDVRETLVSHFKELISAGKYNPSVSDISSALLSEES